MDTTYCLDNTSEEVVVATATAVAAAADSLVDKVNAAMKAAGDSDWLTIVFWIVGILLVVALLVAACWFGAWWNTVLVAWIATWFGASYSVVYTMVFPWMLWSNVIMTVISIGFTAIRQM